MTLVWPGWIAWHSSRQMNDLSFQKSPDKSQISYFLLCNYIGLFIPVARLESDRLFKYAQSLQLAGDKSHTILPGCLATFENSDNSSGDFCATLFNLEWDGKLVPSIVFWPG